MRKTQNLKDSLKKLLANFSDGRLPSKSALAKKFKISPGTVSNAVRALKDEGRIRSIPGKGVYVAGAAVWPASGSRFVFGLAGCYLPEPGLFDEKGVGAIASNPMLQGVCDAAQEASCSVALLPWTQKDGLDPLLIRSLKLDALILAGGASGEELQKMLRLGIPAILGNFPAEAAPSLPFMDIDNAWAIGELVRMMKARGRRRIAFLTIPSHSVPAYGEWIRERFIIALANKGLPFDNALYARVAKPSNSSLVAFDEASRMLSLPDAPDAFICWSGEMAEGAAAAAEARRLSMPDGVSIAVSCACSQVPRFSHFIQPTKKLGRALLDAAMLRVESPFAQVSGFLKPDFIDNASI